MATTDWPLVKTGRKGELAKTAQYLLRHRGAKIEADGIVGAITEGAIRDFQKSQNLPVDGVIGNQTWPKLIVQDQQGLKVDAVRAAQGQRGPETNRHLTCRGRRLGGKRGQRIS